MEKHVLIYNQDKKESKYISSLLGCANCRPVIINRFEDISGHIRKNNCRVMIIDLDGTSLNSKWFRKIKKEKPELSILTISNQSFHPSLGEAITQSITACLTRPLDEEELIFCIDNLCE